MAGWKEKKQMDGWLDRYKLIYGCLGLDGYKKIKNQMNGWIEKEMMVGGYIFFNGWMDKSQMKKIDAQYDGYIIFNGWIEKK